MKFKGMLNGIIVIFLAVTVYSSSDTVIIAIINSKDNISRETLFDTLYIETGDWQTYEINISDFNRESITNIFFNPHHYGMDTGGFYIKDITVSGSNEMQEIEDFESYNSEDSINSPDGNFRADDRLWRTTWIWDGSQCHAAIIEQDCKFLHCYYFCTSEVGASLYLKFQPDSKNWSAYNKLCFTMRNDISTQRKSQRKHYHTQKRMIYSLQNRILSITLPETQNVTNFFLYSISGRLLSHVSHVKDDSFFRRLPLISRGSYIIKADNGKNAYSGVIIIEK